MSHTWSPLRLFPPGSEASFKVRSLSLSLILALSMLFQIFSAWLLLSDPKTESQRLIPVSLSQTRLRLWAPTQTTMLEAYPCHHARSQLAQGCTHWDLQDGGWGPVTRLILQFRQKSKPDGGLQLLGAKCCKARLWAG